jgi:hypothetical protein
MTLNINLLAVIIVLLLVVIYIIAQRRATAPAAEKFSPYESTLVHDMHRDDPSGDVPSYNPTGRSSEDFLFDQIRGIGDD